MSLYIGIDVSKATLDVASLPDGETWTVTNDDAGIAELLARLLPLHPHLIVLEAMGGFESAAVAALAKRDLPVVVVNPRQARDLPRQWAAKTDAIDALMLALSSERGCPVVRPLPDETAQLLDALLTRRRQLLEMLTAEKNRLGFARSPVKRGHHHAYSLARKTARGRERRSHRHNRRKSSRTRRWRRCYVACPM